MTKCSACGGRLHNGRKYIRDCYNRVLCSECYVKKPYEAYLFEDQYGNFVGTSQETSEEEVYDDKERDGNSLTEYDINFAGSFDNYEDYLKEIGLDDPLSEKDWEIAYRERKD